MKRQAFSLMEVIIVIVIMGIMMAAIIGLQQIKETAKVESAEHVIITVYNSGKTWAVMKATEDYTGINMEDLKKTYAIAHDFNPKKSNPWAGDIKVEPYGTTPDKRIHFVITLTDVPKNSCIALVKKLSHRTYVKLPYCTNHGNSSDFSIVF